MSFLPKLTTWKLSGGRFWVDDWDSIYLISSLDDVRIDGQNFSHCVEHTGYLMRMRRRLGWDRVPTGKRYRYVWGLEASATAWPLHRCRSGQCAQGNGAECQSVGSLVGSFNLKLATLLYFNTSSSCGSLPNWALDTSTIAFRRLWLMLWYSIASDTAVNPPKRACIVWHILTHNRDEITLWD